MDIIKPDSKKTMNSKTKKLIHAFNEWDFDSMKVLLKDGADPNVRNEYGNTLLSQACWYAQLELVELMISSADLDADNGRAILLTVITSNDRTPAADGNAEKILNLLIENGADLNMVYPTKYQSESNANALIIALKNKRQKWRIC